MLNESAVPCRWNAGFRRFVVVLVDRFDSRSRQEASLVRHACARSRSSVEGALGWSSQRPLTRTTTAMALGNPARGSTTWHGLRHRAPEATHERRMWPKKPRRRVPVEGPLAKGPPGSTGARSARAHRFASSAEAPSASSNAAWTRLTCSCGQLPGQRERLGDSAKAGAQPLRESSDPLGARSVKVGCRRR